jgi:hypothetical protein
MWLPLSKAKIFYQHVWLRFLPYIEYKGVNLINCRVLPKVIPYNFSLIFPTTKKSSLLRGLPESTCLIFLLLPKINSLFTFLSRTTEVIPRENGLLHPVICPSNTREYVFFYARGFNQSKVAIGLKPGIKYPCSYK